MSDASEDETSRSESPSFSARGSPPPPVFSFGIDDPILESEAFRSAREVLLRLADSGMWAAEEDADAEEGSGEDSDTDMDGLSDDEIEEEE